MDHGDGRNKFALVVSITGAMAFIVMLWVMSLPGQIAEATAYIVAKTGRWSAVDHSAESSAESLGSAFGQFSDSVGRQLQAAEQEAARQETEATQGEIESLRVRIEAASLKQKLEDSGNTDDEAQP